MLIGIVYDYLYTKYELKLSTVSKDTEDLKFDYDYFEKLKNF